jgi:tRNA uracil 4-sulfurtransferase
MTHAPVLLVRYGEIALKGMNRGEFERMLRANVKNVLRGIDRAPLERPRGRIVVRGFRDLETASEAASRVARVFGVVSVSLGVATPRELSAIEEAAVEQLGLALARRGSADGSRVSMRVETKRADKRFPLNSLEVTFKVAAAIVSRFPALTARMKDPDVTIGIEILDKEAFVFVERLQGPRGLPLASQGRAIALLSGGIDSPVAAWLAMKRGLKVDGAYFHSAPFIGDASKQKVLDLARVLASWSGQFRLCVLPLADIQVAIKKGAPESYRTLLYRRAMNHVIAKVPDFEGASTLVTGESLGQVASQTPENLACIEDAADRLVLRPVITYDKEEIMALASKIGTLEISEQPQPDCCTLFQPLRPKIRGVVAELREIEARLGLEPLIDASAAAREVHLIRAHQTETPTIAAPQN